MFDWLKNHFARYTVSGLLDRIPSILGSVKGRLTFGGLIVIFIGVSLWIFSRSSTAFAVYAIAVLALFGGFVVWTDAKLQIEVDKRSSAGLDHPPAQKPWTADELKGEITRLSATQRFILSAAAQSGGGGVLITDLISEPALNRGEVYYRARELQSAGLIQITQLTDYHFALSDSVKRVMQRSPAIQSLLVNAT